MFPLFKEDMIVNKSDTLFHHTRYPLYKGVIGRGDLLYNHIYDTLPPYPRLGIMQSPKKTHQLSVSMDGGNIFFALLLFKGIAGVLEIMQEEQYCQFVCFKVLFHNHQSMTFCNKSAIICQIVIVYFLKSHQFF